MRKMLNEEIKDRIYDKIQLEEGILGGPSDRPMGEIWDDHREAHAKAKESASELKNLLDLKVPGHGLTTDHLESNVDSHTDAIAKLSATKLSAAQEELVRKHAKRLGKATQKKQDLSAEHDDHPAFKATIGSALVHGVFGKSGSSLADIKKANKDASHDAMEQHSRESNVNSSTAHALRKAHGAQYDVSNPPSAGGERKYGVGDKLKHAAKSVGRGILNAALDTMRNPNPSGRTRRRTR